MRRNSSERAELSSFEQHVPAAEKADQHIFDDVVVAHNHRGNLTPQRLEHLPKLMAPALNIFFCFCHFNYLLSVYSFVILRFFLRSPARRRALGPEELLNM
jgi:hypothetical protein